MELQKPEMPAKPPSGTRFTQSGILTGCALSAIIFWTGGGVAGPGDNIPDPSRKSLSSRLSAMPYRKSTTLNILPELIEKLHCLRLRFLVVLVDGLIQKLLTSIRLRFHIVRPRNADLDP